MTPYHWLVAVTPSPSPTPAFDPTTVTPGWVGFVITFAVAILTVVLILDMVRRTRRVNYRAQVREKLAAEELSAKD
jgi:hypothetical protein